MKQTQLSLCIFTTLLLLPTCIITGEKSRSPFTLSRVCKIVGITVGALVLATYGQQFSVAIEHDPHSSDPQADFCRIRDEIHMQALDGGRFKFPNNWYMVTGPCDVECFGNTGTCQNVHFINDKENSHLTYLLCCNKDTNSNEERDNG